MPLKPECWCRRCDEAASADLPPLDIFSRLRMNLCPDCGYKRCPKATAHWLPCGNSNDPGQDGSDYGALPAGRLQAIVAPEVFIGPSLAELLAEQKD
jgi:hypothetical protein